MKMLFTYILTVFVFTGCAANNAAPGSNTRMAKQPSSEAGTDKLAFADVHMHFNWDQEELVSADEAYESIIKQNVVLAVVFSTPTKNALKLTNKDSSLFIPFFSPYITGHSRSNWFRDENVLKQARKGLENKTYFGIGELHVVPGIGPSRDNKIFQGLLKLAEEFNVPFNIHTEAASYKFLEPICKKYSKVRFLWAHGGGLLGPEHSEGVFKSCPNVWVELSARDPKHYGGLVDENSKLRKEWKDVISKYPDRFMVGTDPVWNAHQMNRWYEADEGWKHYDLFVNFHRNWLSELPTNVEQKVRLENALKFFNKTH